MAFTAELERVQTMNAQRVAEEHNAMIKERYRRLQDAEAVQFASVTSNQYTQQAPRASVFAPEAPVIVDAPVMEQTPQVTEFIPVREETPVFTTENLGGMQAEAAISTPIMMPAPVAPLNVAVYTPAQTAVAPETEYSFTPMAKKVLMAVAATATVMLTVIGVNTGIIKRNNARLKNLQEKEETLVTENQELQERIDAATSEETIMQYAMENGMTMG